MLTEELDRLPAWCVRFVFLLSVFWIFLISPGAVFSDDQMIRVLSWPGYVSDDDVRRVDSILESEGYPYRISIIEPMAENEEQMFNLMRSGRCDVTFLTLFFIKGQGQRSLKLLQPVNLSSPRLTNYRYLRRDMKRLREGMDGKQVYYIPFAGGAYGFWADRRRVSGNDLPVSIGDLLKPRWNGKYSLNIAQPAYNVALALLILGKDPFLIGKLVEQGRRGEALAVTSPDHPVQLTLDRLYANAGNFWVGGTVFSDNLEIVSSWGPEIPPQNRRGGEWKFIRFREGRLLWLDTINFMKNLSGRKLEAAEIFANYLLGRDVQNRIVDKLAMYSVSNLVLSNPILDGEGGRNYFLPAFDRTAENIMKKMSDNAMKKKINRKPWLE